MTLQTNGVAPVCNCMEDEVISSPSSSAGSSSFSEKIIAALKNTGPVLVLFLVWLLSIVLALNIVLYPEERIKRKASASVTEMNKK